MFYHGTTVEGANSIKVNGVDLKYATRDMDFGKGFYVTIKAEWDVADIIPNAGNGDIDVEGYIIFYYIIHDDYFYLERMENEDDVKTFIVEMSDNMFFEDITVLLDGNVKRYIINKEGDKKTVTWVD